MDEQRFDHLSRRLSTVLPRRHALPLVTSAALGLLGVRPAHGQPTLGKRRCGRRRCKKVHVCFKRKCRKIPVAGIRCFSNGLPCRNGAICVATGLAGQEICVCPAGTSACGDFPDTACVNLRTDPFHCGSCLNRCLAGVTTCCAVGPLEPGECVDTQTDERHCGGCGRACAAGETCLSGRCQGQCRAGLTLCGGTCVDVLTDQDNCGSCGNGCPVGAQCQNGVCVGTRCKDDGQACQTHTDCCRYPESNCNDGVCARRCSVYGGPCSSQSDCCETGPGTRPPCSGGLCSIN
jgi:hypothetical protein